MCVDALMLEASAAAREVGEQLGDTAPVATTRWLSADITRGLPKLPQADLVTLSYVLDEIAPAEADVLVDRLWSLTAGVLVVIEPGTPAGWRRILAARDRLTRSGAHLLAPCPHTAPCPLAPPDWCHFAQRVARSRMHRRIKSADVPWEDEKFTYIAAARHPGKPVQARVIAPVQVRGGTVSLKLCEQTGMARQRLLSRRDGERFRQARRLAWGDCVGEHATMLADSAV